MTQWSLGPRFGVIAVIAALLLMMGWLAPLEGDSPRVYHSVLLVCGLLPLAVALVLLAEVLGASRPPGAGGLLWVFAAEASVATASARRFNSGVCTLIAALAAAVALEAFVLWAFKPHGLGAFRAILLGPDACIRGRRHASARSPAQARCAACERGRGGGAGARRSPLLLTSVTVVSS